MNKAPASIARFFFPGAPALVAASTLALLLVACQRERRDLHPSAAESARSSGIVLSDLRPGGTPPEIAATLADYQENAYAMNEGKRLFDSYNCSGCHAHGGGAIGPALMDATWIYGDAPANIFATIVEGRPNGMPAFRGKVPDFQVAELTAYVRSLSGLAGKISAPSRNDTMNVKAAENTLDRQPPIRQEGTPPQ
jgi:cytochrome c oxidase cbb3-type subunit 3